MNHIQGRLLKLERQMAQVQTGHLTKRVGCMGAWYRQLERGDSSLFYSGATVQEVVAMLCKARI